MLSETSDGKIAKWKKTDEYGDFKREEQREENMRKSEANVVQVGLKLNEQCWKCTDGSLFSSREDAVNCQYDIERGHR